MPSLGMWRVGGWSDDELVGFALIRMDCFEHKMKTSHAVMGNWRAMLSGPRIVIFNIKVCQTWRHTTSDSAGLRLCFNA